MKDKTYYFDHDLEDIDGDTARLIKLEEERQQKKIILIASESISPKPVREALGSVFTNIYAEGYPSTRMRLDGPELLLDHKHQLSYLRRYSDHKYYKGTEFVDFVESLARKRAAELYATDSVPAANIYANVQPLSGAPGNNAAFTAFLKPGDTVLSMALNCGGHLSHGSEVNRSGIHFNIVSYGVEPGEEKLNYERIRKLALEHRPRMIIAGYSAYPWDIDWKELGSIAREAGKDCLLLADISHIAALIVTGEMNNPIEHADVIMFTTHKALAGPRGAVLLTTDPEKAALIDRAVFPGEQGGPHVNNIAAQAVCFRIAASEDFAEYTRKVKENAAFFAETCRGLGLKLAYGGTESHLFLIDLKCLGKKNGYYVTGEIATRILDQCSITVNKNTISGDLNATHPTGIRIGTPWITQRGFTRDNIRRLAEIINKVLRNISPFQYVGQDEEIGRGKIPLDVLLEVRHEVAKLLCDVDVKETEYDSRYPYYLYPGNWGGRTALWDVHRKAGAAMHSYHEWKVPANYGPGNILVKGPLMIDSGFNTLLRLRGDEERLRAFLQQISVGELVMEIDDARRTYLLDAAGYVIDDVLVHRIADPRDGFASYILEATAGNGTAVREWLRGLADGYILFDEDDVYRKVEGPVVVEDLGSDLDLTIRRTSIKIAGPGAEKLISDSGASLDDMDVIVTREKLGDRKLFSLYVHPDSAAALWEHMLENGSSAGLAPGGFEHLDAIRKNGGLPDYASEVSGAEIYGRQPELFDLRKGYFIGQKHILKHAPEAAARDEWSWNEGDEELRRTTLYEEHVSLGGRMVSFAGWEMPVLYEGIGEEHHTVRTGAGLFDVSHMGVLEFSGRHAVDLLDILTTNYVRWIVPGETQYAYILDPDGNVLDDIFLYREARDRFMMVVNAANADKIWSWVNAVNTNKYVLSRENPHLEVPEGVSIRNLKDPSSGADRRIDLAIQGPRSLEVLLGIVDAGYERELGNLEKTRFMKGKLAGTDVIIARTGYTGEKVGFELFVHPDDSVGLWRLLIESGAPLGLRPTGLGARDSTRTEAGFPLYGHEIEGPLGIFPMENGYAQFLKLHKPFFIGRQKALSMAEGTENIIIRFRMSRPNVKMLHTGDPVANRRGQCVGYVTSSVLVGSRQIGLAYVNRKNAREGTRINIIPLPHGRRAPRERSRDEWKPGDRTIIPEEAVILSRFPADDEMLERALERSENE